MLSSVLLQLFSAKSNIAKMSDYNALRISHAHLAKQKHTVKKRYMKQSKKKKIETAKRKNKKRWRMKMS